MKDNTDNLIFNRETSSFDALRIFLGTVEIIQF